MTAEAAPPVRIFPLFAVPFAQAELADAGPLCAELAALFQAREGDATRNRIQRDTQVGVFESRFDLHTWPDPPVRRLFGFIHASLASVIQQLSQYSASEYARLAFNYHSWFHITRPGGHQGMHNHPMASWSGIFCVDAGNAGPDQPSSGVVRFQDPRPAADMYADAGNRAIKGPFRPGAWQYSHVPGQLVLFPSYVVHEVFPYHGTRPRIVVAFNAWVAMP